MDEVCFFRVWELLQDFPLGNELVGNELYSDGHLVSLQRLSELLKSKKPEDLQEANRLIKNMVKEVRLRPHELSEKIITCKSVFVTARLFPPGRAQNTEGEKAEKHAGGGRQQRQAP